MGTFISNLFQKSFHFQIFTLADYRNEALRRFGNPTTYLFVMAPREALQRLCRVKPQALIWLHGTSRAEPKWGRPQVKQEPTRRGPDRVIGLHQWERRSAPWDAARTISQRPGCPCQYGGWVMWRVLLTPFLGGEVKAVIDVGTEAVFLNKRFSSFKARVRRRRDVLDALISVRPLVTQSMKENGVVEHYNVFNTPRRNGVHV